MLPPLDFNQSMEEAFEQQALRERLKAATRDELEEMFCSLYIQHHFFKKQFNRLIKSHG